MINAHENHSTQLHRLNLTIKNKLNNSPVHVISPLQKLRSDEPSNEELVIKKPPRKAAKKQNISTHTAPNSAAANQKLSIN